MVADSLSAVDRGFESLKIKFCKDIGVDIERVRAIYAAVEGRALLRLDANQGWTAKQAVYAMQALEADGGRRENGSADDCTPDTKEHAVCHLLVDTITKTK